MHNFENFSKVNEMTDAEKKLVNQMYDKKGNLTPLGKKVMNHGKKIESVDEAFGRANFTQQLKKKGIDVNKMHSNNMKDASAAKKRSAVAKKDLADYRKKTGVTSESKDEKFEPHMMYDPKTGEGKMAKKEADHLKMKKMGWSHDNPKTDSVEESKLDEALNSKDKKVIDAFYDGRSMDGKMLSTDGNKLEKTGMGGQTIASKSGRKFKIVAKMDSRSTQDVVKYIEKSFPKNVIEKVELDEALSPQQISKMKKQYANTGDRISMEASKKMSAMVKKFGDEELVQLAKADIKWISTSAITALIIKGKAKLLDESLDIDTSLDEAGLWDNIHNKRKEGRPMRKPGSKGAPSKQDFKNASEETDIDEILTPDLAKAVKSSGLKKFKDKHFNVKKTKADLDALKVRLAKMK